MSLTLEQWDTDVGYHLEMIEAFSQFIENHARDLLGLPEWETKAGDKLVIAETVLTLALERVTNARNKMREKPHVS